MVDHFAMRTHGVNQAFRSVEGIWSHRKCRRNREKKIDRPLLHHMCAGLPSYISTMLISHQERHKKM